MSKFEKIVQRVISGNSDRNINFGDLCNLLEIIGFDNRIKGSHHIYFKEGIPEIINLQPAGIKALSGKTSTRDFNKVQTNTR